MKRLNLKATLICAAVAMTLKVLNHYSSYLPWETWLQDDFVMYWGLWNCAMFVFYLITMILLGFALYQHRNELPTLTPALKRQAQILVSLLGVYIICYLVITFVENVFGQMTVPGICWTLYHCFFWIVIIFFVAWLWQFALVRREKMASEPIGKLGRGFAWFVIIGIIVYLATIVVTVALLPGYESQLMRILPEVIATTLLVWYIILLGSYIRYSDKALKQPTSDQLSNPQ
jgi:hypothetical protein